MSHDEYGGPDTNHASNAGDTTTSDAALAHASKWYRECLLKHTLCTTSLASKCVMPTRLLRIDEDEKYVRLVMTKEEVVKDSHYSTLSHCWGNSDILKLTISNLENFKDSIPLERLPKTFIEAIFVARKFSISYIWIDSLCIIQDSEEDWQTESVSMEDVYGNSSLNIMATISKNSHEGLSRPRDPKMLELCPAIHSKWKDAENDLFYLFNRDIWNHRLYSGPLLRRDKLAAVSALAKCTRAVFDDVYVAGLWRSIFVDQLVWHVRSNSRPKDYRAPTWSWASVDGFVRLPPISPNTKHHIEIDEVRVTPVSRVDDTGSISDGYFRARGLLIRDKLVKNQRNPGVPFLAREDEGTNLIIGLDVPFDRYGEKVIVLPILTNSDGSDHEDDWFHALLLQERAMSPNGFYTRIGIVRPRNTYVKNKMGLEHTQRLSKLKFPGNHGGSNSESNKSTQDGGGADFDVELDESLYLEGSLGSFVVY
ncbi:hypothetical protein BGAL_0005g00580 [Botrytis galanthina]|uniref:Heterokaryon incompatibility domain-containing protein n=1 Tax=Botrytis galanthina TaxID=278940 RepID=A0A4S8RLD0_9HELO|nr:hypothetical protein BGAL_0005g00580 [Botrytis galanthina]